MKQRANYLGAPAFFNLDQACRALVDAFGSNFYLVGSCLTTRDYRDVDVRCILPDEEYDALFGKEILNAAHNARLCMLNVAISTWLVEHSRLPVDFQFQRRTEANAEYPRTAGHDRNALGIFFVQKGIM